MELTGRHILFFDGECAFCDRAVQFYTVRDRADRLRIAPLQSEFARRELQRHGVDLRELQHGAAASQSLQDYYVLADYGTPRERLLWRSRATSLLLRTLGAGWPLLGWLLAVLPAPLLDAGYRAISRNRYRWFGKKDACKLPTPAQRDRLID
jgi:predicted DCC family thiol-disulfide oxidoreductase YuxK